MSHTQTSFMELYICCVCPASKQNARAREKLLLWTNVVVYRCKCDGYQIIDAYAVRVYMLGYICWECVWCVCGMVKCGANVGRERGYLRYPRGLSVVWFRLPSSLCAKFLVRSLFANYVKWLIDCRRRRVYIVLCFLECVCMWIRMWLLLLLFRSVYVV